MATNVTLLSAPQIRTIVAPTGGTVSGGVIVSRSGTSGEIAVAINDIAAAASGPCYTSGVCVTLSAESGTGKTWSNRAVLYWNSSTGKLTTTATGNTRAGVANGAKSSASATTASVDLNA